MGDFTTKTILVVAGAAALIYLLNKKKINEAFTPGFLEDEGRISLITPIPDAIAAGVNNYAEGFSAAPAESVVKVLPMGQSVAASNIAKIADVVIDRAPAAVAKIVKGSGSSSGSSSSRRSASIISVSKSPPEYSGGVLSVGGLGYSVAPQKASALKAQLAQNVYRKVVVNPYANIKR